jgi:hypothetical protein
MLWFRVLYCVEQNKYDQHASEIVEELFLAAAFSISLNIQHVNLLIAEREYHRRESRCPGKRGGRNKQAVC